MTDVPPWEVYVLEYARAKDQPVASLIARRQEFEADAFAAQHASATDLVNALAKLYRDNASTLTPDPLHSLVYDSHPPAAIRIAHLRDATST